LELYGSNFVFFSEAFTELIGRMSWDEDYCFGSSAFHYRLFSWFGCLAVCTDSYFHVIRLQSAWARLCRASLLCASARGLVHLH
jgi:hypothetical protein